MIMPTQDVKDETLQSIIGDFVKDLSIDVYDDNPQLDKETLADELFEFIVTVVNERKDGFVQVVGEGDENYNCGYCNTSLKVHNLLEDKTIYCPRCGTKQELTAVTKYETVKVLD